MDAPWNGSMLSYFDGVYLPRRLSSAAQVTIDHYRLYLRALDRYLGRAATLGDFTEQTIAAFLLDYSKSHAPYSVQSIRKSLLALWRFVSSRESGIAPPDLGPLRLPQVNPTAWTPAELAALLRAGRRFHPRQSGPRTYCCVRPDLWWPGLFLTVYDCGFRRRAALALRWCDVDLQEGWALARAETQKTDRDEIRSLAPDTTAALWAIRQPERELVFPFAGDLVTFYRHYAAILRAAGLPATHRDKTQRLRRTHATWLAVQAGQAAAQESLGHSSLRLTQRAYLDARFVRPINAAAILPRPKL